MEPTGVFYVKSGFIRQYMISDEGKELTVNILRPQNYFPVIWAINNTPNVYFYESITDAVLIVAPRDRVVKQLEDNPSLLYELTKRTLSGLDGITRMMEILLTKNAYRQVTYVMFVLAKRFGKLTSKNQVTIDVPLTHKLIASIAGLSRESTSQEMTKLTKKNILSKKKKLIIIKNLEKLEKESLIKSADDIVL